MTNRLLFFGFIILQSLLPAHAQSKIVPVKYFVQAGGSNEIYVYAQEELSKNLGKYYSLTTQPAIASLKISLGTDPSMDAGSFCIDNKVQGGLQDIRLTGSNETSMLHAVYTFLEEVGIRFEITGPVLPARIDLGKVKKGADITKPFVKKRGIRQHINFPMDISSYPLEEAKEYIRNLARLRFNYIAFHSYPGQWYEVHRKDTTEYAGYFFYGQQYSIPPQHWISQKIRNKQIYCIPAVEPFYHDTAVRSRMAIAWLQEVMKECKRVGLSIRFSFEPRSHETDISRTVETARSILNLYPRIDELELMTEETGGWEPPASRAATEKMLVAHFGDSILNDGVIMSPVRDGQPGLDHLYGQIGHMTRAYKVISDSLLIPKKIRGSLGIYTTIAEYLKPTYQLLRKYAPDADHAVMPAHGARRVELQTPLLGLARKDWEHLMVYSWIEFDGTMYLQQNEIRGIRRLLEYAEDVNGPGNPIEAVCFNHWRTAENRITARYAALSTLYGAMDENLFYTEYARGLGIKETAVFADAMRETDDAGWYATGDLPNVGFCFAGTWGTSGFGTFGRMSRTKLAKGRQFYEKASAMVQQCAARVSDSSGRQLLAFLDNRLRATIVYLKAYEKGAAIQQYLPLRAYNEKEKKEIAGICNQSLLLYGQYMQLHAAMMPDRGCEGTLISAFHTPIVVLQRIRYEYGGVPYTDQPVTDTKVDAPPPPITF